MFEDTTATLFLSISLPSTLHSHVTARRRNNMADDCIIHIQRSVEV
jgi:hypothetical protein